MHSLGTLPGNMTVFHTGYTWGGGYVCLIHLFVCLLFSHQRAKTVNPTLQGKEKQITQCPSLVADKASSFESVPKLVQICLWGARMNTSSNTFAPACLEAQVKTCEFQKA